MSEVQVYKNNSLINAKSEWGVQEQKIFSVLLSDINEKKEKQFSLTKKEIEEILCKDLVEGDADRDDDKDKTKISHLNIAQLRTLSKSLVKKGFSVNISKEEWEDIQIFEKITYRKGVMTMHLTNAAMPYLYELKSYTRYMLDDLLNLKNKYSIRIFELLKREAFKQRRSYRISVEELREFIGVGKTEYMRFNDLDRYVLKKAEKEINEKTQLKFKYEKIFEWKKITEIEFSYTNEKINIPRAFDFKEFSQSKNEKIMKIAIDKAIEINARNNWSITPEEYHQAQVYKTKESNPDNTYGFLVRALEEDWAGFEEKRNLELNQVSIDDIPIKEKEKKPARSTKKTKKDFEEREYDYDKLERQLLGWEE